MMRVGTRQTRQEGKQYEAGTWTPDPLTGLPVRLGQIQTLSNTNDRNYSSALVLHYGLRWACLRRPHLNRLKNRTMTLPRAKRPEHLYDFITLAPTHVVDIAQANLDVFDKQKVDQAEKFLEHLVVRPPRNHAVRSV